MTESEEKRAVLKDALAAEKEVIVNSMSAHTLQVMKEERAATQNELLAAKARASGATALCKQLRALAGLTLLRSTCRHTISTSLRRHVSHWHHSVTLHTIIKKARERDESKQSMLQVRLEERLEESLMEGMRLKTLLAAKEQTLPKQRETQEIRNMRLRAEMAEMQLTVAQEQEAVDRETLLAELEIRAASMMESTMLEMKQQHLKEMETSQKRFKEVSAEKEALASHIIEMAEALKIQGGK